VIQQQARSCLADSCADGLAPDRSLKAHIAQQPALPSTAPPHGSRAGTAATIDLEVVIEDSAYLELQGGATLGSRRSFRRISTSGDISVIG
jgi:hypothetical protein